MAPRSEAEWRRRLDGSDQGIRPFRRFWRSLPSPPRCKLCLRPFSGVGGAAMRVIGLGPWPKNVHYCRGCYQDIDANPGGAEIELTMLFADVRGSTSIAEHITPTEYSNLMNRFYEIAARLLVDREAIVDKFVGDEVVGLFVPGMVGLDHAAKALDTAIELLAETGHGSAAGPWIPLGAAVHTGVAFVGAIGDGNVTDFTALGDAVNTAARVAALAAAGEVLVTAAAADGLALRETLERRHLELRGRAAPVDVVVIRAGSEATG